MITTGFAALIAKAGERLSQPPAIERVDVPAAKVPSREAGKRKAA